MPQPARTACQHLREMSACEYFIRLCARTCVLTNNLVTADIP